MNDVLKVHQMITNTHTTVVVYKAARCQQDFSSCCKYRSQRVRAGSNNEGSCHCSSVPYHACRSELCTLGIGETAGFVVNVSISFDDQVH